MKKCTAVQYVKIFGKRETIIDSVSKIDAFVVHQKDICKMTKTFYYSKQKQSHSEVKGQLSELVID